MQFPRILRCMHLYIFLMTNQNGPAVDPERTLGELHIIVGSSDFYQMTHIVSALLLGLEPVKEFNRVPPSFLDFPAMSCGLQCDEQH